MTALGLRNLGATASWFAEVSAAPEAASSIPGFEARLEDVRRLLPRRVKLRYALNRERLPARLREDAVYIAVAALYLGLATGATVSWGVGEAMDITQMDCGAD